MHHVDVNLSLTVLGWSTILNIVCLCLWFDISVQWWRVPWSGKFVTNSKVLLWFPRVRILFTALQHSVHHQQARVCQKCSSLQHEHLHRPTTERHHRIGWLVRWLPTVRAKVWATVLCYHLLVALMVIGDGDRLGDTPVLTLEGS